MYMVLILPLTEPSVGSQILLSVNKCSKNLAIQNSRILLCKERSSFKLCSEIQFGNSERNSYFSTTKTKQLYLRK